MIKIIKIFLTFTILVLFSLTSVSAMDLDLGPDRNDNKSFMEAINSDVESMNKYIQISIKNLDDHYLLVENAAEINKVLKSYLLEAIVSANESIKQSSVPDKVKFSFENIQTILFSIRDKSGQIAGGLNPVGVAFYSEEIAELIKSLYKGYDKNNNSQIEEDTESTLDFLNSWNKGN